MSDDQDISGQRGSRWRTPCLYLGKKWEVIFFLVVYFLLILQCNFFVADIRSLSCLHDAVAAFALFEYFAVHDLFYASLLCFVPPIVFLLLCPVLPSWARRYFDILGIYVIFRMAVQLVGLNVLVFDTVTPRFLLITQLLFFLPYSLLVWGWVYWRLDTGGRNRHRQLFRLDCEGDVPRPIDYLVASFSSVFSASISGIKGNSASARILILAHGS